MSGIDLSIVIPAYNEEKRIRNSIRKISDFLNEKNLKSEVIVVDDGSEDETVRVSRDNLKNMIHKVIENGENQGKGYSVRAGMLAAAGEYVIFSDADLSTPIEESEKFISILESGYDVVIGSRALHESNLVKRQSAFREFMGRIFNFVAQTFCFKGIHDSQCGFKGFKRSVAQDLFSLQKLNGFSFDAEILYLAQRKNYKIKEEPVTWAHSPQTRVNLFMDPIRMFVDLVRIRFLHRNTFK